MPMMETYTQDELLNMSTDEFAAAQARGFQRGPSVPARIEPPKRDPNAWAKKNFGSEDFTCPSGQTCKLRKMTPESLLKAGILDRLGTLEALADALVGKAEGQPPTKQKMPTAAEFAELLEVINLMVVTVVAEPRVIADPEDGLVPEGAVAVSDIDLDDRMAIMTKAMEGVQSLSAFRNT